MDMDVVERLRRQDGLAVCQDAADEIEGLRDSERALGRALENAHERLVAAEGLLREWKDVYCGDVDTPFQVVVERTRAFLNDTEPAKPPSADPVGYGWKDGRYGPVTTEAAASTRPDGEETT